MMMNVFCFPTANSFLGAINEQKFPLPLLDAEHNFFFLLRDSSRRARFSPSLSFMSDGCCVINSGSVRENTTYS